MPSEPDSPETPPTSASRSKSARTTVTKTTLQRRNTTAVVDVSDQNLEPSEQQNGSKKAKARQSMPSRTNLILNSPPRSSTQDSIQLPPPNNISSPKRTPGSFKPTVQKRFDALKDNSISVLDFYQDLAERLGATKTELDDEMDHELGQYWAIFQLSKKCQVYSNKVVQDFFLDPLEVAKANRVDSETDLEKEVTRTVREINRATFVHFVSQVPFRESPSSETQDGRTLTVKEFADYLSSDESSAWPIRDILELIAARNEFISKIVTKAPQVLVTVDDLCLFFEISTQIVIHYLWKYEAEEKNAAKRKNLVVKKTEELLAYDVLIDSLQKNLDPLDETEKQALKIIELVCSSHARSQKKMVSYPERL